MSLSNIEYITIFIVGNFQQLYFDLVSLRKKVSQTTWKYERVENKNLKNIVGNANIFFADKNVTKWL